MSSDEDELGFDTGNWGKMKQVFVFMFLIIGIISLVVWMNYEENTNKARFEALCFQPEDIEGLTCFELQRAYMVCQDAREHFHAIGCKLENRTMESEMP